MTTQEAEALASRLSRVWAPEGTWDVEWRIFPNGDLNFRSKRGELSLDVWAPDVAAWFQSDKAAFDYYQGEIIDGSQSPEQTQFAAQWLPTFRRCCWLSGAAIECDYHERLEWLHDARERGVLSEDEARALLGAEVAA
jgi:hypothetical protein